MEPAQAVQLDGGCGRSVRLAVSPRADFRQVIHTFDAIAMPRTRVSVENIRFAILELVNNSLRAHRERGEERDILVSMTVAAGRFSVAIRDFGGGFDPGRLPYRLDDDPAGLDLHSPPFEEYQKRNGYKRFGMGIIVAKKTFDSFHLQFLDERDMPSPFVPGRIVGTLITLELPTAAAAADAAGPAGASVAALGGARAPGGPDGN